MSMLRASLETIDDCLKATPIDAASVDRCAIGLSEIGQAVTAQIESAFIALSDTEEPNAA